MISDILAKHLSNRNSCLMECFEKAWKWSFIGKNIFQERGGWVYANESNPKELKIKLAPKSASEPVRLNKKTNPNPAIGIDLEDPTFHLTGWILVANFHTHPLLEANPEPSETDLYNATRRGIPGFVISRRGIYSYGHERTNFDNPTSYPNDGDVSDFDLNACQRLITWVRYNPFMQ